jgi:ferredoxin
MVGCRACEQGCPKGAIVIEKAPLQLSVNENCDGCGLCWTKCPAEAILPPLDWGDSIQPELRVVCQKSEVDRTEMRGGAVLRVPCVKEIGFRFLAAQWMAGMRRLVVCGPDCSGCEKAAATSCEDGVLQVNEVLRVAGQPLIEVVSSASIKQSEDEDRGTVRTSDEDKHMTSRRGLLKAMIAGSLDTAFPSTREGSDPSTAFLEALHALRNDEEREREGPVAAYDLSLDPGVCYGCKVCAILCPTGALDWEEDVEGSGSSRLRIDPSRCHGCGVCVDMCDVDAIDCTFRPGLRVQQEMLFREETCSVCGRMFLVSQPGGSFCPGCRSHDRNLPSDAACAAR